MVIVPAPVRSAAFDSLPADLLYSLLRLRVDVFVVEQQCAYPELDGRDNEPGTMHLWVGEAGAVAGYLRLLAEPDGSHRIGRVCTAAHSRGTGVAARLVEEALRLSTGHAVVLDAQTYLRGWYERFGFAATGPDFDDEGIPHVPMRRAAATGP